ncbi:MAG: thiamine-phosphate kinase [Elusimicrobiota bacterium]
MKGLGLVVSPGDDSFAGCPPALTSGKNCLVITTDLLVENTHFLTRWERFFRKPAVFYNALGYKALAVNLSDLAAMGPVKPLFCLIGLGIPVNTPVDKVDNFYNGFLGLASKNGVFLCGGDLNSSKKWVISVTLIGVANRRDIVKRSGATPGDNLYSTGFLGNSAAGLKILKSGPNSPLFRSFPLCKRGRGTRPALAGWVGDFRKYPYNHLIKSHLYPPVRLKEGAFLSKSATAMIDSSDGLYNSVMLLCDSSKTGAKIFADCIPVSKELKKFTNNWLDYALYGGEDYELIFTSKKPIKNPLISCIGEITEKKYGIKIFENKHSRKTIPLKKGFQHF